MDSNSPCLGYKTPPTTPENKAPDDLHHSDVPVPRPRMHYQAVLISRPCSTSPWVSTTGRYHLYLAVVRVVGCTLDHLRAEVDSCCSVAAARRRSVAHRNSSDLLHLRRSNSDSGVPNSRAPQRTVDSRTLDCCSSAEVERQYTERAHGRVVAVQLPILCRGRVSSPDGGGGVR